MENFVVSARKYRPDSFNNVIGQSHITTTLKNAIKDGHLAHAFLFCGPRGVGKTTCARILAKTINCQNISPETETCNQCESCKSFINNASFNIHELDAASNNSVDDIRNLVEQIRYTPQTGKYKIYIIDEVHMLSNQAFNAFLKTLEEPPSYAIFILATTEKHKIIPTILSRCQIFDFSRIQVNDIATHLSAIAEKEGIKTEPEALHLIAQKADGALRDALSIFDLISTFSSGKQITYKDTIENLHVLDYNYYFKMTGYLAGEDISQALLIFDEILNNGFDSHNFIIGLSEHFRDLLVCKDNQTIKLLQVSDNVKKSYQDQANNTSLSFLMTAMNILSQCDINYKNSKNQRLHVELALMKMAHINQVVDLLKNQQSQIENKPESEVREDKGGYQTKSSANKTENTGQPAGSSINHGTQVLEDPGVREKKQEKQETNTNFKNTIKISSLEKHEPVTNETDHNKSFTLEQLQKTWDDYAQKKQSEGKMNEYAILAARQLTVDENHTINLQLDNQVQLDHLSELKIDLLNHLRKELGNTNITIEAKIIPHISQKKIYTDSEKFTHLSEKYPLLNKMKDTFGLETNM